MDELDLLILKWLQEDGRAAFTQIARQAGVSESTIRSRYANLVEQGIVQTVGVVDPFALGYQAPALIGIRTEPGQVDPVARAISEMQETTYVVMTLGLYDLLVEVICRDLAHLTDIITRRIQQIPGVRTTETMPIARIYKLNYKWNPPETV
jgi:Lrp/AsnC family transcriptional regulator for asnA, asnC and gidA